MEQDGVRINKYLSAAGVCSRREADRQIAAGYVTVDGVTAETGTRVRPDQTVIFCGQEVRKEEERILLALYKPTGIVCTAEKREKNNVIDYLHYPKRIYPVGRLDKNSEGLLLLTNQGELVNRIMRAKNLHEKEYIVTVHKPVTEYFLRGLAGGVPLEELQVTTRRCLVERLGEREFKIVLTQGLNRQIRRMCEYFGYRVVKLVRVRIMNILLGDLNPGEYRPVTEQEYRILCGLTADEEKRDSQRETEKSRPGNRARKSAEGQRSREKAGGSGLREVRRADGKERVQPAREEKRNVQREKGKSRPGGRARKNVGRQRSREKAGASGPGETRRADRKERVQPARRKENT